GAAGPPQRMGFDTAGHSVGAVIRELHVDAEIGLAEELDDGLQDVPVAAGDADEIALDGGLHFELGVLDGLDDFTGLLDGDALLQVDFLFDGGTGRGNDLAVGETLQGHVAFDQLRLEDIDDGLEFELILAREQDLIVLLVELDVGMGIFEIEALVHFLERLLHGVEHFRQFYFGDYVEGIVGHKRLVIMLLVLGRRLRRRIRAAEVEAEDRAGADAQGGDAADGLDGIYGRRGRGGLGRLGLEWGHDGLKVARLGTARMQSGENAAGDLLDHGFHG